MVDPNLSLFLGFVLGVSGDHELDLEVDLEVDLDPGVLLLSDVERELDLEEDAGVRDLLSGDQLG